MTEFIQLLTAMEARSTPPVARNSSRPVVLSRNLSFQNLRRVLRDAPVLMEVFFTMEHAFSKNFVLANGKEKVSKVGKVFRKVAILGELFSFALIFIPI